MLLHSLGTITLDYNKSLVKLEFEMEVRLMPKMRRRKILIFRCIKPNPNKQHTSVIGGTKDESVEGVEASMERLDNDVAITGH